MEVEPLLQLVVVLCSEGEWRVDAEQCLPVEAVDVLVLVEGDKHWRLLGVVDDNGSVVAEVELDSVEVVELECERH